MVCSGRILDVSYHPFTPSLSSYATSAHRLNFKSTLRWRLMTSSSSSPSDPGGAAAASSVDADKNNAAGLLALFLLSMFPFWMCPFNDDDGNKVKKTTQTRVTKVSARESRIIERRGAWGKFGDAVHDDVRDNMTVLSHEAIPFERPNAPGTKAEDSNASSSDPMASNSGIIMQCRTCGKKGEHWTARCPLKQPSETFTSKHPSPTSEHGAPKGTYVPPTKRVDATRPAAPGADMRRRNDENKVWVNNLSENTRDTDLTDLFSPFGSVSRVYVGRGFGVVTFVRREDGERAIAKLNGYGYDNLILRVEWAAPREN